MYHCAENTSSGNKRNKSLKKAKSWVCGKAMEAGEIVLKTSWTVHAFSLATDNVLTELP